MKKLFVVAAAVVMGQLAFAQTTEEKSADIKKEPTNAQPGKEWRHKGFGQGQAVKDLNLTDDQKAKLKDMNAGVEAKRQGILNDTKLTDEQKKAMLRELRAKQAENLKSVLTDEQKAKLKEQKMEMKAQKKDWKEAKLKSEQQGEVKDQKATATPQEQ